MFCKNCGNEVLSGNFCEKCGAAVNVVNNNEEVKTEVITQTDVTNEESYNDYSEFGEYYDRVFNEIENGGSGGFNRAACLFGCFWALCKGAWLSAVVSFIAVCFTSGIGVPIFWIIYGFRANGIMYNVKVNKKQTISKCRIACINFSHYIKFS